MSVIWTKEQPTINCSEDSVEEVDNSYYLADLINTDQDVD